MSTRLGSLGHQIHIQRKWYGNLLFLTVTSNIINQGELEHRRVKRFFSRTNKVAFSWQITKHECRERILQKIRHRKSAEQEASQSSASNGLAYLNFEDSDPLPYTDPTVHYHISNSVRYYENFAKWLGNHQEDPAFRVCVSFSLSNFYWSLTIF
jgi:hypothetical protein